MQTGTVNTNRPLHGQGGSYIFCQKILQRHVVQPRVGQQPLDLGVLVLELPEPPRLRDFQPAILQLSVVDRRFGYPVPTSKVAWDDQLAYFGM